MRQFLLHYIQVKRCTHDTYRQVRAALKFLYTITLRRPWTVEHLPVPRPCPRRLPLVLTAPQLTDLGIEEVITAPQSPWQNPYAERLIGTLRRELLDHVIVLNQTHLRRLLTAFFTYYHEGRCHLSLDRNSPIPRQVQPPEQGDVVGVAHLGGLHHVYHRVA